jgi:hypothetical protein
MNILDQGCRWACNSTCFQLGMARIWVPNTHVQGNKWVSRLSFTYNKVKLSVSLPVHDSLMFLYQLLKNSNALKLQHNFIDRLHTVFNPTNSIHPSVWNILSQGQRSYNSQDKAARWKIFRLAHDGFQIFVTTWPFISFYDIHI